MNSPSVRSMGVGVQYVITMRPAQRRRRRLLHPDSVGVGPARDGLEAFSLLEGCHHLRSRAHEN